jgi:hypothetical protein
VRVVGEALVCDRDGLEHAVARYLTPYAHKRAARPRGGAMV